MTSALWDTRTIKGAGNTGKEFMFTGLIEETGVVKALKKGGSSCVLTISCHDVLEGTRIGDSICVNGVCLTVTRLGSTYFCADVMNETLRRSSLSSVSGGSPVNLERAMPADGRFGGHFVSGHIDGTGTIRNLRQDANAVWYTIDAEPALLRYIVEKGSIAVDGISLTVAAVDEESFQVSVIPHTREVTSLRGKGPGDIVNLECDVIGKYVEKLLLPYTAEKKARGTDPFNAAPKLTEAFLRENGF